MQYPGAFMLINVNDFISFTGERGQAMVMKKAKKAATAAAIAAACSGGQPAKDDDQTISLDSDPPTEERFGNVAQAATPTPAPADTSDADASVEAAADSVVLLNPARVSFQLARVDGVRVLESNGDQYPDRLVRVTQAENATVVTLLVEQERDGEASPVLRFQELGQVGIDADGHPVYEDINSKTDFSPRARALLGTTDRLELGSSFTEVNFGDGAQNALELGETLLEGPVRDEFIGDMTRQVIHGVFIAPEDMVCSVEFAGCDQVYTVIDGEDQCRNGPFEVQLRAGQCLGVYPVVDESVEAVQVTLQGSPPSQEE